MRTITQRKTKPASVTFLTVKQLAGESVEQFVTDLKLKAQTCQFDVLRDSMIRDRIILGVSSQRVQERLLREDDLNLEKAIKVCQAAEAAEKQISALTGPGRDTSREVSVNYCVRGRHNKKKQVPKPTTSASTRKCGSWDTTHGPRACPAYGKNCNKCGKSGHYARVCRSSSQASKPCHYVSRDEYESTELFVGMVATGSTSDQRWSQCLRVENKKIDFKLDTGSDVNIITEQQYLLIQPTPQLDKSRAVMTSYCGVEIPNLGVCSVDIRHKKRQIQATVEVVREYRPAILGGADCARLWLVRRVNVINDDVELR